MKGRMLAMGWGEGGQEKNANSVLSRAGIRNQYVLTSQGFPMCAMSIKDNPETYLIFRSAR